MQIGDLRTYGLQCSLFGVEVRTRRLNGRWIASADTADGPTLGRGGTEFEAIWEALAPFEIIVDELLASLPAAR